MSRAVNSECASIGEYPLTLWNGFDCVSTTSH